MKHRFEVFGSGFDDGLQGITSSPFDGPTPSWLGLRVPLLVNTPDTRYLFLLASVVVQNTAVKVCGIRQGVDIGMDLAPFMAIDTTRPVVCPVVTPTFRFSDGANVSFHLVKEPIIRRSAALPLTNTRSFMWRTSDTAALLYETFTTTNPTATGAPTDYPVDLSDYSPPIYVRDWQGIGGLKSFNDIRYPWQSPSDWNSINEVVEGNWRVSLYASVLQTDPVRRPGIKYGTGIATNGTVAGVPPEEAFLTAFTFTGEPAGGPQYWRVYGSILCETEQADAIKPVPIDVRR